MKLAVLVGSLFLVGCASTPYPYDNSRGAAAGTMIGGYLGYTLLESAAETHPMLSIFGTIGGAAIGRNIGGSIGNNNDE